MKNKKKFLDTIDFLDGEILYNSFDIVESVSLDRQVDFLNEDMLQIGYEKDFTLDIGWRPYINKSGKIVSADGRFIISVIKNENWMEPVLILEAKDLISLRLSIKTAIEKIKAEQN